jgi:glutaredoxin
MLTKILLIVLLVSGLSGIAQESRIVISEKKTGKRLVLFAENRTLDTLNAFFMITSKGYRRSASKPVLKSIPPKQKAPMMTLIEITGQEQFYSYDLIVNEAENNLSLEFEGEAKDIEQVIKDKLVIFTVSNCDKCRDLLAQLEAKHIRFQSFSLDTDALLYRQFIGLIEQDFTAETRIRFPVIWNKDHVIFSYEDIETIAAKLTH